MDFAVKISDISDTKLLPILEEKFREAHNSRLELYKTIKKICEAKGSTVRGARTHKISLNSQDIWFEEPTEIHNAINHLHELDQNLANVTKLKLVNQMDLGALTTQKDIHNLILKIQLLSKIDSAAVAIKGVSTHDTFFIDEIRQSNTNIIAKTKNMECIKKYYNKEVFSRELNFSQHFKHCSFIPEIIEFDEQNLFIVMPWYKKIDIQHGPDISIEIKTALDFMRREGISHNDISIFDEIFYTDGKLTVIDWEMGTVGNEVSHKTRVYEDSCLSDAYAFLRSNTLLEYEPIVVISDTVLDLPGRETDYFKVAAYAISQQNLEKFKKMSGLLRDIGLPYLQTSDQFYVSLIFKKLSCTVFEQFHSTQGIANVKKALDAQAIFSGDYMLKLWRYWWQKRFSSNENDPVFQFRRAGMEYRDKIISQELQNLKKDSLVLDIGSNAGEVSAFLTSLGYSVIGFEPDTDVWKISVKKKIKNCRLYNSELDLSKIKDQRATAAVLLSVFHRIWALKGPQAAKVELKKIAENVDIILFEGSSHLQRYGQIKPPFESNDVDNCHNWHMKIFHEILPNWKVEFIDSIPHTSTEPLRLFYTLKRE